MLDGRQVYRSTDIQLSLFRWCRLITVFRDVYVEIINDPMVYYSIERYKVELES